MTIDYSAAEALVREAGAMLLNASPAPETIHAKGGEANFVTDTDVKIQSFLFERLSALVPGAAFFGEEDTRGNTRGLSDGYTFIIDAIDGTTNFMFGYNFSCVSVGLAYGKRMLAGWVYNPYARTMMHAVRGEGAYLNGRRVYAGNRSVENGLIAFSCARYNDQHIDKLFDTVKALFYKSLSVRLGGSAAIDLSRVAAGSNTAYLEMLLQPYDYAAASLLIEEAGGVITQLDGSAITLDRPCSILAGTVQAHAQILSMWNGGR